MTELIGWGSAVITLPTFGLQTYKQWRGRHEEVPASTLWFFILAILGSGGQVIYSWLLDNWVFLIVNVCLIANNLLGLGILAYRWRVTRKPSPHAMQPVPQG